MTTITEIVELYRKECLLCGIRRSAGDTTTVRLALEELVNASYTEGYSFAKREAGLVEEASRALHYNED